MAAHRRHADAQRLQHRLVRQERTTSPTGNSTQAGPFDRWLDAGSRLREVLIGFLGGVANNWRPALFDGTTPIEPYLGKPDYNLDFDLAVTVLVYSLIPSLTPTLLNRTQIFVFIGLAWLGIVLWRVAYSQLFIQPQFRQRALWSAPAGPAELWPSYAGGAPRRQPLPWHRLRVGRLHRRRPGLRRQHGAGIRCWPARMFLVPMAQALEINEVILAITHRHAIDQVLFDDLLRCRELGIHVGTMSDLYERLLGRVPVQHVGRDLSWRCLRPTRPPTAFTLASNA